MAKIIVSTCDPKSDEAIKGIKKKLADSLGVMEDDITVFTAGLTVSVVEVPAELTKARKDKDAKDKAEAEKATHEKEKATKAATKSEAKAHV